MITIVGEVNDANQIISDGKIYEVDDTPQGDDLVKNHISKKVKAHFPHPFLSILAI
jgi:hypothetical protein